MKPPVLVFDLDDTLYLEHDYAISGFHAVGIWVQEQYRVANFAQLCIREFLHGARGHIFNRALKRARLPFDQQAVQRLVEVYRTHLPDIRLAPDAKSFLTKWPHPLGLVSDGPLISQSTKVHVLQLDRWFDHCILTDRWGRSYWKPHPRAFREIQSHFNAPASRCVYIADNPRKDFLPCLELGWRSVRIRRVGGIYADSEARAGQAADVEINTLDELNEVLFRIAA